MRAGTNPHLVAWKARRRSASTHRFIVGLRPQLLHDRFELGRVAASKGQSKPRVVGAWTHVSKM